MADFCKACSDKLFGPDMPPDLGGITKQADWEQGKAVAVLCEGCGPIQVDPEGNCVSRDCLCAGKEGHGLPWHLETSKIINETPTGWVQTAEPWPLLPRTKHQLVDPPGMVDFSALDLRVVAAGASFPPAKSYPVQGRPLEDLAVAEEYVFEKTLRGEGRGAHTTYTTPTWPGEFKLISVDTVEGSDVVEESDVVMEFAVGPEVVPDAARVIECRLNDAIRTLERANPEAWAVFKRFNGNAVVYSPVDKELPVNTECLRIVYSLMRVYNPGVVVTGLGQGYYFDGPTVRVYGKLKEEADPNARIDLKDA